MSTNIVYHFRRPFTILSVIIRGNVKPNSIPAPSSASLESRNRLPGGPVRKPYATKTHIFCHVRLVENRRTGGIIDDKEVGNT